MRRFMHPFDIAYGVLWVGVVVAFWASADRPDHAVLDASRVGLVTLLAYLAGGAKYRQ